MNRCFLSIVTILVIIAMVFAACSKGSGTQQQTASETQTQTGAEHYPQTLTGDLSAFAESASENNNKNDLFIHTEENPIKIWGWSKDGKTGISELCDAGGRGGMIIKAFIFNTVSDTVLWEENIDSFDYGDGYDGIPENEIAVFFGNFQNVCRQQFGIETQEVSLVVPSKSAIGHKGKLYDIAINSIEEEDDMIRRYSVVAETDGKRKIILSKDTFLPVLPEFSWYSISPLEERALIILRWSGFSHSYGFIYAGCHLLVGF